MSIWVVGIIFLAIIGGFIFGITRPLKGRHAAFDVLDWMENEGFAFHTRPDGYIDGVKIDTKEYTDEEIGRTRRFITYIDRETGEKIEEGKEQVNRTQGGIEKVYKIQNSDGGIFLTERKAHTDNPDEGELEPIFMGPRARKLKEKQDVQVGMEKETEKELKSLRKKVSQLGRLEKEHTELQERVEELEDENSRVYSTISTQKQLLNRLRARNAEQEAKIDELEMQKENLREELKKSEAEKKELYEIAEEKEISKAKREAAKEVA